MAPFTSISTELIKPDLECYVRLLNGIKKDDSRRIAVASCELAVKHDIV